MSDLPDEAWIIAMAGLPKVGPSRLRALLGLGTPGEVWQSIRSGRVPVELISGSARSSASSIVAAWSSSAKQIDPAAVWQAHVEAGIGVAVRGSASFPGCLDSDDDPPTIIFWKGDIDHLAGTRVAIVGTRRATRYGIDVANELARELSLAGVSVVSGLALGIDGAAHSGAIAVDGAPPIAVVGSGLDRVYPREHRSLWRCVTERGVILSEHPLGTPAVAWQFPARNRIIAALADVVVVVESQSTGGALGTAIEGARRSRPVLAVPGPVTAPSSAGTNQLLFDGCAPARDVADVLLALGREPSARRSSGERRPLPSGGAAVVLEALPWQSTAIERIVIDTGLGLGDVMLALDVLEADGWVVHRSGRVERVARAASNR